MIFSQRTFLEPTYLPEPTSAVGQLVDHTVRFSLCRRLWTVTERPQRLVTFETFDQSDEVK